jgi:hypothetical protein
MCPSGAVQGDSIVPPGAYGCGHGSENNVAIHRDR